ncbi:tyrosine-type recombinase/integrase [Telmatocola sphagniphila]|uniref:Tyrosine-type recombinase/integrase n=1 Tax=Telmatocola sphagniphila TaxID=1123043 RepID=A0A8E6B9V9_9BACT|nr:site-specific integrase [Telmatocola sphagniphila]QVL33228.1 tyrosine-type recombinase/integrase [Telmatocola sphagniphila]
MGSIFKQTTWKSVPPEANIITRDGKRFAVWIQNGKKRKEEVRTVQTGKDKGQFRICIFSKHWYAKYRDSSNLVVVTCTECKDEANARKELEKYERQAERVRKGIITPAEEKLEKQTPKPIAEHFDAFEHYLRSKEVTKVHRENSRRYLNRLAEECSFVTLLSMRRESFEKWLANRIVDGMSARSRNAHREALNAFCNWCVATERLLDNPFRLVRKANEDADPRRQRRAMTAEELRRLLQVAKERPLKEALMIRRGERKGQLAANVSDELKVRLEQIGRERALIYKTLVLTGLRRGELASLTVAKLSLAGSSPHAYLDAADEKNRTGSVIPIRDDLADDLRHWLADKLRALQDLARARGESIPRELPAQTKLFAVPAQMIRTFDRDLKAAGIPKVDDRGRTLDVHAMRTTFGTLLSKAGVSPRTAQAAMRHSDISLTMNTYTDPKLLDVRGALDGLPELSLSNPPPPVLVKISARETA